MKQGGASWELTLGKMHSNVAGGERGPASVPRPSHSMKSGPSLCGSLSYPPESRTMLGVRSHQ